MDVTDLITGAAETANISLATDRREFNSPPDQEAETDPDSSATVRTDPGHGLISADQRNSDRLPSSRGRPMQKGRFLMGLVFSSLGIALMLAIAVGALQNAGINGRLSLPAVGVCMIVGLILLGGGFGVMATAAPTFDDDEFDRLVEANNMSQDSDDSEGMPSVRTPGALPHEISRGGSLQRRHSEST